MKYTTHSGESKPRTASPRFGDWFTGGYASESNPRKHGMYVKTIRRRGRMNPGVFYELTDGKGDFWLSPVENLTPRSQEGSPQ